MNSVKISDGIFWVGVKDPELRVFDIIMETRQGTTYNSYLIKGADKTALIDCVKKPFAAEHFAKIEENVALDKIDYLVVNHTEPDHSGAITELLAKAPNLEIICSAGAVPFVKNTLNIETKITGVKDNHELDLGGKKLTFKVTPYMHWPDTMMEYLNEDRILFSCDGFAAHISSESIFSDEIQADLDFELKYYYDAIMRPFSTYIRKNLTKLDDFDIDIIAPSHGPVFREKPRQYIDRYAEWAADKTEGRKQVTIFYVSAYGNTARLAESLGETLKEEDLEPVLINIEGMDEAYARDQIEASLAVVYGTPTFNGDAVRPTWDAVNLLSTVSSLGKKAAVFGSYGWSGEAVKLVADRLTGMRLKVFEENYRARLIPSDDDMAELKQFGKKLADFIGG